jgi:hypothetical protein
MVLAWVHYYPNVLNKKEAQKRESFLMIRF